MEISIEFCMMCNYGPKATSLATDLFDHFRGNVKSLKLIPGEGGAFEIKLNDTLIYSKLEKKQFPGVEQLISLIENKVDFTLMGE